MCAELSDTFGNFFFHMGGTGLTYDKLGIAIPNVPKESNCGGMKRKFAEFEDSSNSVVNQCGDQDFDGRNGERPSVVVDPMTDAKYNSQTTLENGHDKQVEIAKLQSIEGVHHVCKCRKGSAEDMHDKIRDSLLAGMAW